MTAATLPIVDPLLPQPAGGMGRGALLALVAHGALVAALVWGLNWRTETPEVVSAELWAAVPQVAAPKAEELPVEPPKVEAPKVEPITPRVETPPPKVETPPDAQIAIEKQKERERQRDLLEKERADKAKAEKLKAEKAEREAKEAREKKAAEKAAAERAEKAAQQAAEARLARQREENLKRMLGQAAASGASPGTAAQDAAPSRSYAGRLVAHIKPNIVFTETLSGNPAAEVEVRAAPSGTIVARRLVRSSGVKEWDEAVLRAIDRTGTLPRDIDGRVPPTLLIAFRPND